MARIFLALSLFALALLAVNIGLGFASGDFNGAAAEHTRLLNETGALRNSPDASDAEVAAKAKEFDQAAETFLVLSKWKMLHFLFGVLAALVTVLVNSINVTYFIGTARWCKEVADAYHLGDELPARSEKLKKQAFPWSVLGILSIMAIIIAGAASDPSANFKGSGNWVTIHMMVAIIGSAFIGYAFFQQVSKIGANYEVIDQIMARVREIQSAQEHQKRKQDAESTASDETIVDFKIPPSDS